MHSNRVEQYTLLQYFIIIIPNTLLSIYRPTNENINFLDKLSEALDIYSNNYENICIFGDFNATPENSDHMINFMNKQCLSNLIKGPTCFNPLSVDPQNGQTHSNNSPENCVCKLTILWGWRLKG